MSQPATPSETPQAPRDRAVTEAIVGSRAARFRRGMVLGIPIFLGYLPVGVAFGVLAGTLGFSVLQAVLCSATALAGAGQFISLEFIRSGATVVAVLAASTIVNLRYVLFASTMSRYLRDAPIGTHAVLAFSLTDETFAVNVADHRQGLATPASMAGVGLVAWCGWVLGTLIGALGTNALGDPNAWGAGFAMPAMFTALFFALAEDRRHVIAGCAAGAMLLGLAALRSAGVALDSNWHLLIASLVTAAIAAGVWREE